MSEWAIRSKKRAICSFLVSHPGFLLMVTHFWWATWAICSHRSFLVSTLSDSLTSLIKKEGMSKKFEWIIRFLWAIEQFAQNNQVIRSFAHLSWATWANCSHLLFCHEWPEQFAYSFSFVLSDLSELLTVTHLIWVIWAIWSNEQIPNPGDQAPLTCCLGGLAPPPPLVALGRQTDTSGWSLWSLNYTALRHWI